MMQKHAWLLTVITVAALLVAGCGLNATAQNAATPQPTATVSAPATSTPAAALPASPAAGSVPAAQPDTAVASTAAAGSAVATSVPAASAPASAAAATAPSTAAPAAAAAPLPVDPTLSTMESAYEKIYAQVNPSVVLINVIVPAAASSQNPFSSGAQSQQALGSGFVWDKQGHIVTNNHVIDGATDISVTFYDGTTVTASLVGADPDSDLAVILVKVAADQLQPVTLADSTVVKVGQIVEAIGNPYGEQNTLSTSVVSALGRTLPTTGDTSSSSGSGYIIPDIIQTDTAINPGNSGGVLLDSQGRVIGVTAAIESPSGTSAGVGFAIPSAIVQKVVPVLIQTGHFDHPWIGISGTDMVPELAAAMNMSSTQRGALIVDVVSGSPADKAGLHGSTQTATIQGQQVPVGGDVIVAINGQPVKTFDDVTAYLARYTDVGQSVTLTVLRNGKQQDIKLTLAVRPDTSQSGTQGSTGSGAYLGVTGISVTSDIAKAMNLPANQQGVLIEQIDPNSPADNAGLQGSSTPATIGGASVMIGGDIIVGFANVQVTSLDDLKSVLNQAQPGDIVRLTVIRGGQQGRVQVQLDQQPTSDLEET